MSQFFQTAIRFVVLVLFAIPILTGCIPPPLDQIDFDNYPTGTSEVPINLIPMYGHPDIKKTDQQIQADRRFIQETINLNKSRKQASQELSNLAWYYLMQHEAPNQAMRRFNQAWLLDANNYMAYWGFGVLQKEKGEYEDAIVHFQKAVSLIASYDREKPRLLTDFGHVYAKRAQLDRESNETRSRDYFQKANALAIEALQLDPGFTNAYFLATYTFFDMERYDKAWEYVIIARKSRIVQFDPRFIEDLSRKMPEPE